jgi:hypothetical protein
MAGMMPAQKEERNKRGKGWAGRAVYRAAGYHPAGRAI